nr:immunoglobulin heavy chain junction region [Homo sapiens]
SLRVEDTAVYY